MALELTLCSCHFPREYQYLDRASAINKECCDNSFICSRNKMIPPIDQTWLWLFFRHVCQRAVLFLTHVCSNETTLLSIFCVERGPWSQRKIMRVSGFTLTEVCPYQIWGFYAGAVVMLVHRLWSHGSMTSHNFESSLKWLFIGVFT